MKYFTIEIQTLKDGTQAQSITEKSSEFEAVAQFHTAIAYAMNNDNVSHVCAMAISDKGIIYANEAWTRHAGE